MVLLAFAGCHRGHGPRVFVTNEDDGTVTVIDATSFAVVETIHVGQRPRGARVSRDGKWLYVALGGSLKAGPGVESRASGRGAVALRSPGRRCGARGRVL